MNKYELVIIWTSGEKDVHEFESREAAEHAERGYKTAFGNQIEWTCVRQKI